MYFDIGGSSSVFCYRRVVQCVVKLEGCPMNLIGGLSKFYPMNLIKGLFKVCLVNLSEGCPME